MTSDDPTIPPDDGMRPPAGGGLPRYNTTPNWQDPLNPPSPGDPYWAEWIAANPTYRGQGYNGPANKTESAPTPGPAPNNALPPTPVSTLPQHYNPPPAFVPPPAFSYKDFTAPTGDDVLNDPGYQFRLGQGEQALERSAAAKGTLNTGGTLKDILGFGQDLASTEYSNMYGRKAQEYATNRGNALSTYNTNYGTQYLDPYQINYTSQYTDPFRNNFDLGNAQFSQMRNNRNDAFNQRYQLLGLY